MVKKIVIANSKGGVSKTTTTNSMATAIGIKGYKVLVIDFDPQGNLSDSISLDNIEGKTVYELMKGEINPSNVIQKGKYFDIIPANLDLAAADLEITQTGKITDEELLNKALTAFTQDYLSVYHVSEVD